MTYAIFLLSDYQYFRHFFESFWTFHQLAQATVIDSISMNFYIAEPVIRLPMFNF